VLDLDVLESRCVCRVGFGSGLLESGVEQEGELEGYRDILEQFKCRLSSGDGSLKEGQQLSRMAVFRCFPAQLVLPCNSWCYEIHLWHWLHPTTAEVIEWTHAQMLLSVANHAAHRPCLSSFTIIAVESEVHVKGKRRFSAMGHAVGTT
jgi:hypothetical protein